MVSPAPRTQRLFAALIVGLLLVVAGCGPTERKIKTRALPVGDDHQVLWTHNMIGPVIPSPALDTHGNILASSTDGTLYALDPATGETNWDFHGFGNVSTKVSTAPLTLPGGLIAWPGAANTLYGLPGTIAGAASGIPLWKVQFRAPAFTPLPGPHGRIYVADQSGHLTALDVTARAANVAWTVRLGAGGSLGNPVLAHGGLIVGTAGNALVAVRDDGSHGSVVWKFSTDATIGVSPAAAPDGTLVVGSDDGFEYGVSPAGHQRWKHAIGAPSESSPLAASNGKVYVGDSRGTLTTLDAATGHELASVQASGAIRSRPALGPDGSVYVGTQLGWIQGFSSTGSKLFAIKSGGPIVSSPLVTPAGVLVIGSTDQFLYAVKPR